MNKMRDIREQTGSPIPPSAYISRGPITTW
jgi:hypothetical protein